MNTEITEYKKVSGSIFYDAECHFCTAMARRFEHVLASRHFELLPLQTPGLDERLHLSKTELLTEMRVLRPDGNSYGGADALLEIARDFWWAWPLRQLGRVPAMRNVLRAGYRWIARNRSCTAGSCEIEGNKSKVMRKEFSMYRMTSSFERLSLTPALSRRERENCPPTFSNVERLHRFIALMRNWGLLMLPLLALPMVALLLKPHVAPWVFMWAMAFALYAGCKWLTYRQAVCRDLRPKPGRTLAYLLAWPGMDAADFLDAAKLSVNHCSGERMQTIPPALRAVTAQRAVRTTKPRATEWLFATAKMSSGVIAVWLLSRLLFPAYPILAGWVGMIGVVFILHFGLFHLLALFWRQKGIAATPVMRSPALATSLAEFWGQRWNTAFNELAFRFAYRPIRRVTTPATATLLVFGLSGLIHDLLISVPAGGGYGLPTLYFLIQGLGAIIERSRYGHRIGLGRGARGWFFTLFVTVAPVFWLFHPPFIKHVILPMLNAIGAT